MSRRKIRGAQEKPERVKSVPLDIFYWQCLACQARNTTHASPEAPPEHVVCWNCHASFLTEAPK